MIDPRMETETYTDIPFVTTPDVGRSPGDSTNTGGNVGGTTVGCILGSLVTGAEVGSDAWVGNVVG